MYLILKKKCRIIFSIIVLFSTLDFAQICPDSTRFLGCATSEDIWRYYYSYWNQLTPGNAGKWGSVENVKGQYSWTNLDKIYNSAVNRNFPFKEHTLVWGSQEPSWISSLDSASQRAAIENWFKLLGELYPLMAFADVVNEPFHAVPSYKKALGGDGATGWDWIITSFELARKYLPSDTKLLLNEYSVLQDYNVTSNYITVINLLKDRGLIDGIGIQGHYFEFRSHTDATSGTYVYSASTLTSNLNRLVDTGLPVYITEFDIDESDDTAQLEQYKVYFPIFWNNPGVKGITFWGYIASDVWSSHPNTYLLSSTGAERPAMEWLKTYVKIPLTPSTLSPVGTTGEQRNPILIWNSSKLATSYHIQVSTNRAFSSAVVDTTITDTLYQIDSLAANTTYYWHVSAINETGTSEYSTLVNFKTGDQIVSVKESEKVPTEFNLFQNYPNPFNPETTIEFSLPERSSARITVINVLGQVVKEITNGNFSAGKNRVKLNASELSSGIYFYKLEAGKFVSVKKLILMK